jgi:hypothetical protein
MSRFCIAFAVVGLLFLGLTRAEAGVVITVNKSTQRLSVVVNGTERHEWPVSTARWGYNTPNGTYQPERLARQWYSRKYDWSPMPYSIFFHGGYAIHGSYEISRLGRPASHGCIRLLPKNAAVLFGIVQANRGDTRIVVTGERPSVRAVALQTQREERRVRQALIEARRVRRARIEARRAHEALREERSARRRYRARTAGRYQERLAERRPRQRQADFDNVFAPPPRNGYRAETDQNWNDLDRGRNPNQRALRQWWYDR